jgi:hypothetical protein
MKIYRVEHKNGNGIIMATDNEGCPLYNSISSKFINRYGKFPLPDEDYLIDRLPNKDEYCAFKTKKDLKKWIKKNELKELISLDFNIQKITIEKRNLIIGKHQILFKKDHIVENITINEDFL